jgi:hypothetical protein
MIRRDFRPFLRFTLPFVAGLSAMRVVPAATPPALVNYQGVLRDQNDKPLSGTFDMDFRFMDAVTGGNEILIDHHVAPAGVTTSNGLFNVALGSGGVADGSGPGTYTSLDAVFRDYTNVWLEVKVGTETLAPRTRIVSAAYALNATHAETTATATNTTQLNGQPSSFYLDTSSTYQIKSGGVRFQNSDPSIAAMTAVCAGGSGMGVSSTGCWDTAGYFETSSSSSTAVLGYGGAYGVRGYGTVGGLFVDPGWANYAYVGDQPDGAGIAAIGTNRGVYFGSGGENYGDVGYYDGNKYYGIWAHGYHVGGYFENAATGTYAYLDDTLGASIRGNGSKNFVQNHPERDDRTITYASLEGDEVGTYTRGSARLVHGEARVALGETFQWVTDPELGLTVYVTPVGAAARLYVAEKSTTEVLVKSAPGDPDVEFDYIVVGLRIGFENTNVVREKDGPAPVPRMTGLEEQQVRHPELRATTPRARFEQMERSAGRAVRTSYAQADALLAKINASDHGSIDSPAAVAARLPNLEARARAQLAAAGGPSSSAPEPVVTPPAPAPVVAPSEGSPQAAPPVLPFETSEPVDAGDLLVLDPTQPGTLHRASSAMDPGVVGVAAASSTIVEGHQTVGVASMLFATVKADARFGAIRPGDLLVSSSTLGHAMVARDPRPGTVFGKALDGLDSGTGSIRVLLLSR